MDLVVQFLRQGLKIQLDKSYSTLAIIEEEAFARELLSAEANKYLKKQLVTLGEILIRSDLETMVESTDISSTRSPLLSTSPPLFKDYLLDGLLTQKYTYAGVHDTDLTVGHEVDVNSEVDGQRIETREAVAQAVLHQDNPTPIGFLPNVPLHIILPISKDPTSPTSVDEQVPCDKCGKTASHDGRICPAEMVCALCKEKGHWDWDCPKDKCPICVGIGKDHALSCQKHQEFRQCPSCGSLHHPGPRGSECLAFPVVRLEPVEVEDEMVSIPKLSDNMAISEKNTISRTHRKI